MSRNSAIIGIIFCIPARQVINGFNFFLAKQITIYFFSYPCSKKCLSSGGDGDIPRCHGDSTSTLLCVKYGGYFVHAQSCLRSYCD